MKLFLLFPIWFYTQFYHEMSDKRRIFFLLSGKSLVYLSAFQIVEQKKMNRIMRYSTLSLSRKQWYDENNFMQMMSRYTFYMHRIELKIKYKLSTTLNETNLHLNAFEPPSLFHPELTCISLSNTICFTFHISICVILVGDHANYSLSFCWFCHYKLSWNLNLQSPRLLVKWFVFLLLLQYLRCSCKLFSNTQISRLVVSFNFCFAPLYPKDTQFFTIFIVHFSIIVIIIISFVLRKPKCLLIFICFSIRFCHSCTYLQREKNFQFIYYFTCSLYAY